MVDGPSGTCRFVSARPGGRRPVSPPPRRYRPGGARGGGSAKTDKFQPHGAPEAGADSQWRALFESRNSNSRHCGAPMRQSGCVARDLISRRTRRHFRESLVGAYMAEISDMFEDEGFSQGTPASQVSGRGRELIERYYATVDWSSGDDVDRVLRVFDQIYQRITDGPYRAETLLLLKDDGLDVIDGRIVRAAPPVISAGALAELLDPEVIERHLVRIAASVDADPEQAIGAAKELIESTTKLVLRTLGESFDERSDVPGLVKQAQKALLLHPDDVAGTQGGAETIKRVLGNLSQVAVGVAELRNLYGTGHGRSQPSGLKPRHAHLAVGCATVYCRLLLDTMADPAAAWRRPPS